MIMCGMTGRGVSVCVLRVVVCFAGLADRLVVGRDDGDDVGRGLFVACEMKW